MSYTFNNIKIILQTWDGSVARTIARLQPLTGGTHLQHFGFESRVNKTTGIVVGDADLAAFELLFDGDNTSGVSYDLYYDTTLIGTFFPKSMTYSRTNAISQTMRTDLPCDSPVYKVELELYVDE